jgi:hypothetical protein
MTERTTIFQPVEPTQEIEEREPPKAEVSDGRFRKPVILQPFDPAEAMSIVEAAHEAGISERQMRTWCPTHQIGRKIGGRYHVSRPLLTMYLHGDRTSERFVDYLDRLSIDSD